MANRAVAYSITVLLAVALLLPRVSSLHTLGHSDHGDEPLSCELCEVITTSNQVNLTLGDDACHFNIPEVLPSAFVLTLYYNAPDEKIASPTSIYNKPPPIHFLG